MNLLTVGTQVHLVVEGPGEAAPVHREASIAKVVDPDFGSGMCDLADATGMLAANVPYSSEPLPGWWHWPEQLTDKKGNGEP